jgi:hypothetical protein
MDPRRRADEVLARASARGAFVVTPDNATSPMDSAATVRIPRQAIAQTAQNEPDATAALPAQQGSAPIGWPQQDFDPTGQQSSGRPPTQQQYPQPRPYPQR